ncbi:MAG: aminoacyl-tRNA hydrolase [Thermodesulfobacteriota bacterium]
MFLIVGLGNPGPRYEITRHNAGFMLVDRLAGAGGTPRFKRSRTSLWTEATVAGKEAVLAKPQTFMNLSGEAVAELKEVLQVPVESIIVAYDDCDLPFGRLRLRKNGGSGGHRGIDSIIQSLGSRDFLRVRLGIGRPSPPASGDTVSYVLASFSEQEAHGLDRMLERGAASVEAIVAEGIDAAMNKFNSNDRA